MQNTLMMASGLLAAIRIRIRFPFIVLAVAAFGCMFVPWSSVWIFMVDGPPRVLHFCAWVGVVVSALLAMSGLAVTILDDVELSEYPLGWYFCCTLGKEHVEVWRVLMWLLLVPAELASIALLPVYGFVWLLRYPCRLLKYPWRLLRTVITFEIRV